ncbi:Hypothetical_protein [Hexamita inflata]|uniref:Hypothetical_protein n=1 Tax=Hexamita inflata TaxID=28002 RepID=A0ABP1H8N5_9EUKA
MSVLMRRENTLIIEPGSDISKIQIINFILLPNSKKHFEGPPLQLKINNITENKQTLNMSQNDEITELKEKNGKLQTQINQNSEKYENIHKNVDEIITQRDNAFIQCKKYEIKLDQMLEIQKQFENQYQKLENSNQQYIIQLKQHEQLLNEEHEKLKETNLQLNTQIEKQKATVNELELKCQNLENTATKQKENFQNLQTDVQNKNGQIQKQDLELNNLKKSMQETSQNLTNEYEIKLKHQQYNYENTIQLLQQHLNDKLNIQQTAEQYVIQVQNEAKQWIANEQNRLTQEFSIKEQSLLNQYNNQKEHDRQNLQKDFNAQKKALDIETTKHTSELKRQISALENQLKQQQQQIYVTNTSTQLQTEVQNDVIKSTNQKYYMQVQKSQQIEQNQLSCTDQDSVGKSIISISISESEDEPNIQNHSLTDSEFPKETEYKLQNTKYDNEVKQEISQIIYYNSNQQLNQQKENNIYNQNEYSESAEIQIGSDSDADNEVQ